MPQGQYSLADVQPMGQYSLADVQHEPDPSVPNTALAMRAAGAAIPAATTAAMVIATDPRVPRIAAQIGRVVGATAPVATGVMTGTPTGILSGLAAAAPGRWAGGRAGWFGGKLAQDVALPIAHALDALAPYAQAINTASGAQGMLDLAQMAEPTRKDIGTLGISFGPMRSQAERDASPALLNEVAGKIMDYAAELKKNGIPAAKAMAVKILSAGSPGLFGKLMTIAMQYGKEDQ